jgi:L-iditol 2-dehydrogenase
MRALVKTAAGAGHVALRELPARPPGPDELRIAVRYCGICGTDLHIEADEFPNDPPVIMGHEYCGAVEAVGEGVAEAWRVGERVVGELHTGACGACDLCLAGKPHICPHKLALGSRYDGAFAEYVTVPAWLVHRIPEGVPWEVAAVTEPFAIAGHCLVERGALRGARRVLVTGSSTMGLLAVVWASRLGAQEILVAGTDLDAPLRLPLARALGATATANVQRESLRDAVTSLTTGEGVDAWIECSGAPAAIAGGLALVKRSGKVVLVGLAGPETIPIPWNTILYRELDLFGCFSSPPSSWALALEAAPQEQHKLRRIVTAILPLERWQEGFAMMRRGEGVKILLDMQA